MYNNISERRIKNNRLRRNRQIRRNLSMLMMTVVLTVGFSVMFFSFKAKAQSSETPLFYKYYKSITVGGGDTIWDFAKLYADTDFYESYECYIKEVMDINHLKDDQIVYGQHIIIPYYSNEFKG